MIMQSKGELRRTKMLERIKQSGKASISELMDITDSSIATIRRDLEALEQSNFIIRTIGGAVYDEGSSRNNAAELAFADKRSVSKEGKERIAADAAALVEEGDVICLTGGTTTFLIAKALKDHQNITVVTNAVNIAAELFDAEGVQVVVSGGVMRHKSYELIGPLAESVIEKLNITKMFLGVDGVSREHGFTTHSELEARIAQLFIARSSKVYAVYDQTKLQKSALFTIIPYDGVTGVITDL
ncbi:DeoR/GlpR family DNA-binding transcription regulator [Paenibacillus sp. OV219]|uniref:DeoR/GlpR family DNA-binding transcription regulator n=1 Tax=Paenibacillus sp. OV219 TaxID=1884377 RepID=UPI0008AD876E|nr:DeoR/GlpR family DNA-binding transcription regulator [Paenibacillus sp. OV219]SEO87624.1 transcriptional regulator, DeoR family [Paenibacillus sp. OV219]